MAKRRKILIVDDEEQIHRLLDKLFTKAGYDVRCAKNGKETLEISEEESFQLMFFDLNMPKMNGVELCREIRKINPMAIIYAVTGYASLFELSECRGAGFDDYFVKPVEMKKMLKIAADAFEKIDRWKKRS